MFDGGEYLGGTTQDSATRKQSTNVYLTQGAARSKFFASTKTFTDFNVQDTTEEGLNLNEFFSAILNVGATTVTMVEAEALFTTLDTDEDEILSRYEFE